MASIFENVSLSYLKENGQVYRQTDSILTVRLEKEYDDGAIKLYDGDHLLLRIPLTNQTDYSRVGRHSFVFTLENNSILLGFSSEAAVKAFQKAVKFKDIRRASVFNDRTDEASATQYFQFYGYLSQQQNMMQDYTRTSTYQRAMLANVPDFRDKVVLDVGAGSGILSFFAIQAGAKKVYAIEASSMAQHAETLVHNNKLTGKIIVLPGKVEEIEVPEPVDVIISEPMGYMLFNERMLESYLHAKKWLKTGGRMFPTRGDLHIAPFTDDALFMEQFSKSNFWYQQSFHGVDLSSLRTAAVKEYFRQPIVDTFDIRICMSRTQCYTVDFQVADETDLHKIDIPLQFQLLTSGTIHGLAFWFDVAFIGSVETVWLSTAPTEPLTHWYQVRCLLESPIFAKEGQILSGKVVLNSNKRQSYDVDIELYVEGTNTKSSNTLDLKNPFFRYTGQAPPPPPGHNNISPTETYWNSLNSQTNAMTGSLQTVNGYQTVVNGVIEIDNSQHQVHHNQNSTNLVPLGNSGATIHPGSIPSFGNLSTQRQSHVPTSSIGGGVSPALLTQTQQAVVMGNTSHYPVSNTFMIGDYVTPGNIILPGQGAITFGQ